MRTLLSLLYRGTRGPEWAGGEKKAGVVQPDGAMEDSIESIEGGIEAREKKERKKKKTYKCGFK